MSLDEILTSFFCRAHAIDTTADYIIEEIPPENLIVPERLDIIFKTKYVDMLRKGYDLPFIKDMYKMHIEAFSLGKYTEPGTPQKNSISEYLKEFDALLASVEGKGFDATLSAVPVGKKNIILNGSHRVAIAASLGLKVPAVRFEDLSTNYGYVFFRERLLPEMYLDFAVYEYCKIKKKNVYAICLWPRANIDNAQNKVLQLMQETTRIIYTKEIMLTFEGLRNFIIEVYSHQDWVGAPDNDFAGAHSKTSLCYRKDTPLFLCLVECDCIETVRKLKDDIRVLFGLGNHSVHSTDEFDEVKTINELLLNENSVHFLNNARPYRFKKTIGFIDDFKKLLLKKSFCLDNFAVDSSGPLGIYGLRDIRDLDYLTMEETVGAISDDMISCHNKYAELYDKPLAEILYDPRNHFFFRGIKFVALPLLKVFKTNRGEDKDKEDIELIGLVLDKPSSLHYVFVKFSTWLRIRKRNARFAVRYFLIRFLQATGLYHFVRKAYRCFLKEGK